MPSYVEQLSLEELFSELSHYIEDESALVGKGCVYDMTIYSIVKYSRLLMESNSNIIDSLYVPDSCVLYSLQIADR